MAATRDEAIAALTAPGAPFELEAIEIGGIPMRVFAQAPASMRDVLAGTAVHGDRDFLVYEGERTTYREHLGLVAGLAGYLADEHGIGKGDRIAIGMRNYPEWVISFWASMALGAIAVPLNAWWLGHELEYAITDSGAKALLIDGERLERLADVRQGLGVDVVIAARARGEVPEDVLRWEDLRTRLDVTRPLPDVEIVPEDPATILYTSGTTGLPKGALATNRNHVTNIMNTLLLGAVAAAVNGTPPPDPAAPPPQGASLQVFPFFHIGGLSGLYVSTAVGSKLVTMYKWDVETAVGLLAKEHITSTAMVPTVLRQLLDSPLLETLPREALAGISSGGGPVPPDLIRRIETEFETKVSPANGYGLTETTSAVVINSGRDYFDNPDSVGRPAVGADVRIVDPDGNDLPDGSIGELWVRGPNVVTGYWHKPEATAAAFTDGWFHSGDLARRDDRGFIFVVDRLKDVVIRGGENIYSAEVEAVLFEHPAVLDVAVVGLPHDVYGEEVAAVVELRDDQEATAGELQRFAAERLARFKVPEHVFFRTEPLPRTATGKVLKRELRDELTTAAGTPPTG
ncbi:MAG: class I adenylate-forming enzyme family protein [Ilumatobacteraceae bacterium]